MRVPTTERSRARRILSPSRAHSGSGRGTSVQCDAQGSSKPTDPATAPHGSHGIPRSPRKSTPSSIRCYTNVVFPCLPWDVFRAFREGQFLSKNAAGTPTRSTRTALTLNAAILHMGPALSLTNARIQARFERVVCFAKVKTRLGG